MSVSMLVGLFLLLDVKLYEGRTVSFLVPTGYPSIPVIKCSLNKNELIVKCQPGPNLGGVEIRHVTCPQGAPRHLEPRLPWGDLEDDSGVEAVTQR